MKLSCRKSCGETIGPRLQAAGYYLTIPGGGGDLLEPGIEHATYIDNEGIRLSIEHDVALAMDIGTDAGIYPQGMNGIQFAYMVEWGMTPMEAIKAATSVAARYLDWGDRVGAVAPGLYGDLIAVKGKPLSDISTLEQVEAVVKGGLVFKAPEGMTE